MAYYDFIWKPSTLMGSTAAMAAGVTTRLWNFGMLFDGLVVAFCLNACGRDTMPFERGQRIKMLTWFEGVDEPDTDFGKILAVEDGRNLRVAMESGPIIIWIADHENTEVVETDA